MVMSHMVLCEGVNVVDRWSVGLRRKWLIKYAPPLFKEGFSNSWMASLISLSNQGSSLASSPAPARWFFCAEPFVCEKVVSFSPGVFFF